MSTDARALIVGGGIAGLAAAALLIRDAGWPGRRIEVLEQGATFGGSLDGGGDPTHGYVIRGGRMLEPHFGCTFDLFRDIPSLATPGLSVTDEIHAFTRRHVTSSRCRLVRGRRGQEAPALQLSIRDRFNLVRLAWTREEALGATRIETWFGPHFLASNFWFMWASMFAFQPWHGVAEFRRYMLRFMHLLPGFNRLEGIIRTPLNQYDSLVRPLTHWLATQGVALRPGVRVTDLRLAREDGALAPAALALTDEGANPRELELGTQDLLIVTPGSMTEHSSLGTMDTPPPAPVPSGGAWDLWERLARHGPAFGRPSVFRGDVARTQWTSFTLTLRDRAFFDFMEGFTGNAAGTGGLVTFPESGWLLSVVLPRQPHFDGQPADVQVCWGYALHPMRDGDAVCKAMTDCSGREILRELLFHLPMDEATAARVMGTATCIPCAMPWVTSQFMPRLPGDRPQVLPPGTRRIALVGQFCEQPEDTVFTVEYSVRSAQAAVYGLCAPGRTPTPLYRGWRDPRVVLAALRAR